MFFFVGVGRNQNVYVAMIIVYGNEKQTECKWPLTMMSDTFKSMKMCMLSQNGSLISPAVLKSNRSGIESLFGWPVGLAPVLELSEFSQI